MKKVGRNDPCPCNSGKKFKKCCMLKNQSEILHTLVKVSDYGSSDAFIARMQIQIFEIRDFIFTNDKTRSEFDKHYGPVFQNLMEARIVKDECIKSIQQHLQKIEGRKITQIENM